MLIRNSRELLMTLIPTFLNLHFLTIKSKFHKMRIIQFCFDQTILYCDINANRNGFRVYY
jgi:hypothetical protein